MDDIFFVSHLESLFLISHDKDFLVMMDMMSCIIYNFLFLFITEAIRVSNIEIEFSFGHSLVHILPSVSATFGEMEMYFMLQYIIYQLFFIHLLVIKS